MTKFTRTTVLALLPALAVVLLSSPSVASQPKALLVPPHDDAYLPRFGFSSFNVAGYGERVTHVRWGGLAAQMGLEPGDTILRMNDYRLDYHGSWNDALYHAMTQHGGQVRLRIRDVRTGRIVSRFVHLGGIVPPITPKYYTGGPNVQVIHHDHHDHEHYFYGPVGPIAQKSKVGPMPNQNLKHTIKEIANMFDD
jgi:predicted metalloprotease with PDZ domain